MLSFIETFKSVVLSTVDVEFFPHASYAPFVHFEHRYYVFISELAKHTQNLHANCESSLLFIEDESQTNNIFARKRVSLLCDSVMIDRAADRFLSVMENFKEKFDADMVDTLVGMKDFNLYEFHPIKGEAVFGFGEAYDVGGVYCESLLPRQSSGGHKS